jgi:hypothetical protein
MHAAHSVVRVAALSFGFLKPETVSSIRSLLLLHDSMARRYDEMPRSDFRGGDDMAYAHSYGRSHGGYSHATPYEYEAAHGMYRVPTYAPRTYTTPYHTSTSHGYHLSGPWADGQTAPAPRRQAYGGRSDPHMSELARGVAHRGGAIPRSHTSHRGTYDSYYGEGMLEPHHAAYSARAPSYHYDQPSFASEPMPYVQEPRTAHPVAVSTADPVPHSSYVKPAYTITLTPEVGTRTSAPAASQHQFVQQYHSVSFDLTSDLSVSSPDFVSNTGFPSLLGLESGDEDCGHTMNVSGGDVLGLRSIFNSGAAVCPSEAATELISPCGELMEVDWASLLRSVAGMQLDASTVDGNSPVSTVSTSPNSVDALSTGTGGRVSPPLVGCPSSDPGGVFLTSSGQEVCLLATAVNAERYLLRL